MSIHKLHKKIVWDCDITEERLDHIELSKKEMDAFKLKVREEVGLKNVYFKTNKPTDRTRVQPESRKTAKKRAPQAYKRRTP